MRYSRLVKPRLNWTSLSFVLGWPDGSGSLFPGSRCDRRCFTAANYPKARRSDVVGDYFGTKYKIVEIDLNKPARENWKEIVPESKDLLESAALVGGKLCSSFTRKDSSSTEIIPSTSGDHDDRVLPGHSFKFAATLQPAQGCANPQMMLLGLEKR